MKRYREALEDVEDGGDDGAPQAFRWRGQRYEVIQVLGHWHEDAGWWQRPDGATSRITRTDLWRVEARNGSPTRGVYEIVRRSGGWRLDRIWD
jgi:hypothetical protein